MKELKFPIVIFFLILGAAFAHASDHMDLSDNIEVHDFYNRLTHIIMYPDNNVGIYEIDDCPHPVLRKKIFRGLFKLTHLRENFYSLSSELPGKKCIETMEVERTIFDGKDIEVRFKLPASSANYTIMAKNVQTDSIFCIRYPCESILHLPVDNSGYVFSILPYKEEVAEIAGITYGFGHTIKYLTLPTFDRHFFTKSCLIEVTFPMFTDSIFDQWCVNGDIMQIYNSILNEKIIWHGYEFTPYSKKQKLFKF